MTTTDVAVIDDEDTEVVEYEPLTKRAATALDKKIRASSDKITTNFNTLIELLIEAQQGEIHKALGLPSWPAYVKDAVQIQVSDKVDRKEFAKLMSGQGMSQRAIAGALGVSQKTVDRDLEDEEVDEDDTVTSLDGSTRKKSKKAAAEEEPEVIDAEVVEEDDEPAAKQQSVGQDFKDEMYQLKNDVEALNEVIEDERFAKSRKRIAKACSDDLDEIINSLHAIRAELADEE